MSELVPVGFTLRALQKQADEMGMTVNRAAWRKLLQENLDWLMKQPRTLERDHTEQCLKSLMDVSPSRYEKFLKEERDVLEDELEYLRPEEME